MSIVVVAPRSVAGLPEPWDGVTVVRYGSAEEAEAGLAGDAEGYVILSDGLAASELARVAHAVAAVRGACIEVRSDRWDGSTPSPLSAACRGVISGFGVGGVVEAVVSGLRT